MLVWIWSPLVDIRNKISRRVCPEVFFMIYLAYFFRLACAEKQFIEAMIVHPIGVATSVGTLFLMRSFGRHPVFISGIVVASFWMFDLSSGAGKQERTWSRSPYFRHIWWSLVFLRNRNMWISLESRQNLQVYISINVSLIVGFLRSGSYHYFLGKRIEHLKGGTSSFQIMSERGALELINLWPVRLNWHHRLSEPIDKGIKRGKNRRILYF